MNKVVIITGLLENEYSPLPKWIAHQFKDKEVLILPSFEKLGDRSIEDEIKVQNDKLEDFVDDNTICIAHSAGCFFALTHNKLFNKTYLLDPSLDISKMFSNQKDGIYDMGICKVLLSEDFVNSIDNTKSYIELLQQSDNIEIISAGKGAAKIAEGYLENIDKDIKRYIIPNADHNFSLDEYRDELIKLILEKI